MGSVLVAAMVHSGVEEPSARKFHPFFVKGACNEPPVAASADTTPQDTADSHSNGDSDAGGSRKKRRTTDSHVPQDDPEPKKQRRQRKKGASLDGSIISHLNKPVPNEPSSANTTTEPSAREFLTPPLSDTAVLPSEQPTTSHAPIGAPPVAVPEAAKKVLRFNPKTGTLGSPPKPKQQTPPSRIVSIKYGHDESSRKRIGHKITSIMENELQAPGTPTKKRAPRTPVKQKAAASIQNAASKVTHPFFSGKTKQPPTEASTTIESLQKSPARRQTIAMSTPVSPKKLKNPFTINKMPQFGNTSTGTRVTGAMHPLWPAQGMSHVRGDGLSVPVVKGDAACVRQSKKSKGLVTSIEPGESVLSHFVTRMDMKQLRESLPGDSDTYTPAPPELRLPNRHFESGKKLQARIRRQLRTYLPSVSTIDEDTSLDELAEPRQKSPHPAISRLYHSLKGQLSAYDQSTCETLAWTQKYAPLSASQVIQVGKEPMLLRQWLEALKVQSVESGGGDGGNKIKSKSDGAPKKKRKKTKLEGFVVDTDEEDDGMDELSEDEDSYTHPGVALLKKSVVRAGDASNRNAKDPKRLANAVVISGPHGSGKTATVYAVAKELGFQIFEINSSSRRSGKDVLEKVGDVTRNHLVQQHRAQVVETEGDVDELAEDLKSGKQGTMTSFFKPKPAAAGKKAKKMPKRETNENVAKPPAPKAQRQSLILLEEVDVLYEEDKQFWAILMGMIAQSKRPFIMTCNEESLLPIQTLKLHGIFRFSPPPAPLAVDLCLLVAANEGHALRRTAVEALFRSRNSDLRATITELNYWCQIGVGDRRGGFDWFYLRWPKGCDLDENGDVVRVVSQDTYRDGMGWIGRDLIATTRDPLEAEEEAMNQSWNSWQFDMTDWQQSLDMKSWSETISASTAQQSKGRASVLSAYDDFCGTMSDADLASSFAFGGILQEHIDPSLPDLPTRIRDDFIVGQALLEADPIASASSPSVAVSTTLKSLARETLYKSASAVSEIPETSSLKAIGEDAAISALDELFRSSPRPLTRLDIAHAFDPIAVSQKATLTTYLDPSVFDRTLKLIVQDVAPWVRGIVAFDHQLMQDRVRLSNLLSEGGKRKRMRNTRAAFSALEGGTRQTTRRERYFGDCLNTAIVMHTCGTGWQDAVAEVTGRGMEEKATSVGDGSEESESS